LCGEEALKKEPHEERLIDQTKYRDAIVSGFRCCGIYPIDINEVLPRLPRVETYEGIAAVMVPIVQALFHTRYNPPPNVPTPRPSLKTRLIPGSVYKCLPQVPTYGTYLNT
jgi:hypothetical protein